MAVADIGGLSVAPPPPAPPPAAPPAAGVPPGPWPPPPRERWKEPHPVAHPGLGNDWRCSLDRDEPGEGPETPTLAVPLPASQPSRRLSPRRLVEPGDPRSFAEALFVSPSAHPARLPVADEVSGR